MFLKPKEGLLVPNIDNNFKPLSPEGETVELSRYWKRRLKDGDVVKAKKPERTKALPK